MKRVIGREHNHPNINPKRYQNLVQLGFTIAVHQIRATIALPLS